MVCPGLQGEPCTQFVHHLFNPMMATWLIVDVAVKTGDFPQSLPLELPEASSAKII